MTFRAAHVFFLTQSGHLRGLRADQPLLVCQFCLVRCLVPSLGGGNETTRVHQAICWFSGRVAARRARTAVNDAGDRVRQWHVARR